MSEEPERTRVAGLDAADFARYSRQLVLPRLGIPGQQRLAAARVLVVGAGGLGSPVLTYLAAAGVGTLGVLDSDAVELSNLHRQVIHTTGSLGRSKVDSVADMVAALNPAVRVIGHPVRLDAANAPDLVSGYDVVVDGADNFPTRYVVNDACAELGIPVVWGAVLGFDAQVSVFWANAPGGAGVDLRDLFPVPPAPGSVPSCAEAGVIGAVCGQAGTVMAGEVVKLVTGIGEPLLGRVLVIDALRARWSELPLRRSPARAGEPDVPVVRAGQVCDLSVQDLPVATGDAVPGLVPGVVSSVAAGLDYLLDVRTPQEFAGDHLDGSVNIPLPVLLAGGGPPLPTGRPILVICRSGARAEVAAGWLAARGFSEVRVLPGGLQASGSQHS